MSISGKRCFGLLALIIVFVLEQSCGSPYSADVDCVTKDCQAACAERGYPEGDCADDICQCRGADAGSYPWTEEDGGVSPP